jgi:type III pantothenate kinase
MILCLDVGNTQIHGGVFKDGELLTQFRKTSASKSSSDEYGIFLRSVLRENGLSYEDVQAIALCTVVPDVLHSLNNACRKYFSLSPFILQAGVKTGLKIKYRNPIEVGSDRIANSIAAMHLYPQRNLVVVDFGTATTLCVINKDREYLGGSILPGMRISMQALEVHTAKLPSVEIKRPESIIGRSTIESIQSGLYFGQISMVKGMMGQIISEQNWSDQQRPILIGTGGFSSMFESAQVFDHIVPDLALKGLYLALQNNS